MYSNEFIIVIILITVLTIYIIYKNKTLEKMSNTNPVSPENLTAIKNLGEVAKKMISPDGNTITLPYNVKIDGYLTVRDTLSGGHGSGGGGYKYWLGNAQSTGGRLILSTGDYGGRQLEFRNGNLEMRGGNVNIGGDVDIGGSLTTNNKAIKLTATSNKAYLQTSKHTWRFSDVGSSAGNKHLENATIRGMLKHDGWYLRVDQNIPWKRSEGEVYDFSL